MSFYKVLLLLGSDLNDRKNNLNIAISLINSRLGKIEKMGEIMETQPIGFTTDTLFLNQLVEIRTKLSPIKLLTEIKKIEKEMGRKDSQPLAGEIYSSRIIDIDILKYENLVYKNEKLTIPHSQIITRNFVAELIEKMG